MNKSQRTDLGGLGRGNRSEKWAKRFQQLGNFS
jgi:hypothetical protein